MISILRHIVQRVSQAESVEQAMAQLVSLTRSAMKTDCCSLYLVEKKSLLLCANEGLASGAIGHSRLAWGEGIVGLSAQREEPINLADARKHKAFKLLPELHEDDYRAFLAVPILHQRQVVGVMVVQQYQARQFSEEEESFLITLASQLAPQLRDHALTRCSDPKALIYSGKIAAQGIAIAKARLARPKLDLVQPERQGQSPDIEWQRLLHACKNTQEELAELGARLSDDVAAEINFLFECYQALLSDPQLLRDLKAAIEQNWQAETAVSKVVHQYVGQLEAMQDETLRERAADLRELGQRLLGQLARPSNNGITPDQPVILVAKEITAPMLAEIQRDKLAGIISLNGGVNSHAAILARAMGVPALIGVEGLRLEWLAEQFIVLDALEGQIWLEPSHNVIQAHQQLACEFAARSARFAQQLTRLCLSADHQVVKLQLNAGLSGEDQIISQPGISAIGLYRTETLFMAYSQFPTEQQQERAYRTLLARAEGKPVIVRTLDIGGDKPLPYFPIREDNPFLGWRGIRLSLDHPDLFLVQIRALIRANSQNQTLKIMVPMVSRLDEIQSCRRLLVQAVAELSEELGYPIAIPALGIMIEIPAAIYQLEHWWPWLDFASVGSNDLTQYLLAVDRNNAQVSACFDSFHPALVNALDHIVRQSSGKDLSVCGEIAGDPLGALMLLALGYRQLSMNSLSLGAVHYLIEHLDFRQLEALRCHLLMATDSTEIKQALSDYIGRLGLAELILKR